MFQARSQEEQVFTVIVPDHRAEVVKKLLRLVSTGVVEGTFKDSQEIDLLAKSLGVS